MEVEKRIQYLRNLIDENNYNYYVLNRSEISDFEFDKLLEELIFLEQENPQFFDSNSPTQRVGSGLSDQFQTVKHKHRMLSLGNTYSDRSIKNIV